MPCLLTDRDEMSKFYKGPSIDASYQVSVHLSKRFQRRFLKIGQSETRIACGGYVSYQISDQLALWFQRRRLKCEKLTDDGCQVMAKALWQGELKRTKGQITIYKTLYKKQNIEQHDPH